MLLLSRLQAAALCDSEFSVKIRQIMEKQYQYHEENSKMKPAFSIEKKHLLLFDVVSQGILRSSARKIVGTGWLSTNRQETSTCVF